MQEQARAHTEAEAAAVKHGKDKMKQQAVEAYKAEKQQDNDELERQCQLAIEEAQKKKQENNQLVAATTTSSTSTSRRSLPFFDDTSK